jgi:sec-independent protein translocase protein TatA
MFGIGVGELVVIFIIAVVVIGPNKLPEVARTIGKAYATAKRATNQFRDQMQEEVKKFQEMDEVKEFRSSLESEIYKVKDAAETYIGAEIAAEEKRLDEETRSIEQSFNAEGGPLHEVTTAIASITSMDTPEELAAHALPSGAVPFVASSQSSEVAPASTQAAPEMATAHSERIYTETAEDRKNAGTNGGNGAAPSTPPATADAATAATTVSDKPLA